MLSHVKNNAEKRDLEAKSIIANQIDRRVRPDISEALQGVYSAANSSQLPSNSPQVTLRIYYDK